MAHADFENLVATREHIRIRVDGSWSAREVELFYGYITDVYNILLILLNTDNERANIFMYEIQAILKAVVDYRAFAITFERTPGVHELWGRADAHSLDLESAIGATQRLRVDSVHFGSEGVHDLIGVAEVIGHLKDLILSIIETYTSRQERLATVRMLELKAEAFEIENQKKLLGNLAMALELAEKHNFPKQEISKLGAVLLQRKLYLEGLVSDEKIIGVE